MTSWEEKPLGAFLKERLEVPDVDKLISGKIPIISKISFNTGQIELRRDGETRTKMILIQPGDLVLSGINAYKGAIAIHRGDRPIAATIHYSAYSVDENQADIRFLWWLLRSSIFRFLLERHVPGGIKTELKAERFLPIPVSLPSPDIQRNIVAYIEALAAQIAEARGLRQGTLEEAETLLNAARRIVFTSLKGASVVTLETVCATIIDNLHSNPIYDDEGEFPCIRSSDVGWGELFLDTAKRTNEVEYIRRTVRGAPEVNDIVLVREGGGTGKAALVEEGQVFSLGQRVMMLRPLQDVVLPWFMLNQMLSPLIFDDQILPQTKGSASPHLNISALRKFKFLLPDLREQRRVVEYLDALYTCLKSLKRLQAETAAELDALLPSVLDKAFKGEL